MPLNRVPVPLRQKFLPHDGGYEIVYSKHINYPDDYDCEVKYLMNCSGEFTYYVALFYANSLTLRYISETGLESHYLFSEELSIKDIGYFRNADDELCLVVALNSSNISIHPHCAAFLRWGGARFQLIQKVAFEQEICCLKVIADEQNISQLAPTLHHKMSIWPHIISVGTHFARCYLFHFPSPEQYKGHDPRVPLKIKLTDGLKPFRYGDEFVYSSANPDSGYTESKKLKIESVSVTCVGFLEKCRVVLVGFSFGGIMSISLTESPIIDPLMYPCSAPVQFIAPLEPDDDPRMHLWFFVAYSSTKAKPLQLCLYEVMFGEDECLPLSERTWLKPRIGIKLVIPFHNTTRWISLQTLVRERGELRGLEDSSRDSSRFGSDKDRSVVFFSYIANDRSGGSLKGGLFDLNAYFYKRLIGTITHDGTIAQQCAFMSTIQPIPMHYKEENFSLLKDVVIDTALITRFISNVSDAEQMFYPSALEIAVVHVAGSKKCYQLSLPSLPDQLLSTICADLEMHMADPSSASAWLSALGFFKNDPISRLSDKCDDRAVLYSVLSTLLSHERAGAIVHYIRHTDSVQSRHLIAAWIWEEIDKASKKLHETTDPLFARFSGPLNPAGQKALAHVYDVFVGGVQILRELVSSVEREEDETKEYVTTLEARRFATESLRSYTAVIHRLISCRILPVSEDREVRLAMGTLLSDRRAKSLGQLNIDKLVSRMRRKCPAEPFWHAEGPQWYPPALLNLLSLVLVLNIPTKWKGQLLTFYLLDYASCKVPRNGCSETSGSVVETVKKQMHGILGMTKSEIQNVYDLWCADGGQGIKQEESFDNPSSDQQVPLDAEIRRLLDIPRSLSSTEENSLKALLKSVPFGEFIWNSYLAKHRRFDEVKELPVPSDAARNDAVLEYLQLLPIVRTLRQSIAYSAKRPSWPSDIKEAIEKFEKEKTFSPPSCESATIFNRGKTPVRLLRRQSNADALISRKRPAVPVLQQLDTNLSQLSTLSDRSPLSAKRANMELSEEDVNMPEDVPINTLNNIADILRTPKARACAAAHAESQRKWADKTPEGEIERPAPRSILKSGRTDRNTQPRNRLQFNLPSSLSSSSEQHTISEASSPEHIEKMTQPNFDESFEYGEDTTNTEGDDSVEVQDEPFEPLISPDLEQDLLPKEGPLYSSPVSQDDVVLERSMEVQDEEDDWESNANAAEPPPLVEEEQGEDHYEVGIAERSDIGKLAHEGGLRSAEYFEQDEAGTSGVKAIANLKSSVELEDEDAMETEDLELENSVELQEECQEVVDVVRVTRSKTVVNTTVSPPSISPSPPVPGAESGGGNANGEHVTVKTYSAMNVIETAVEKQLDVDEPNHDAIACEEQCSIETQSDDSDSDDIGRPHIKQTVIETLSNVYEVAHEVQDDQEGVNNVTFTIPAEIGIATGDFVSLCSESVTTVRENSTDEVSNVKLVDYSFTSDSTFDLSHTPRKHQKAADSSTHVSHIREVLEFDGELVPMLDADQLRQPSTVEESSSETQSSPRLPSPTEFGDGNDLQEVPLPSEPTALGVIPEETSGPTALSVTPEEISEPTTLGVIPEETFEPTAMEVITEEIFEPTALEVIPEETEKAATTPPLSPQQAQSELPTSTRKRIRSSAKKVAPATPTRRSQRLRHRSLSIEGEGSERGVDQESDITSLTSGRSGKLSDSVEETESKEVQKSPSRAARSRKVSTSSSEASSNISRTPTRRTPTRSATKSKQVDVETEGAKGRKTPSKASKALNEKFTVAKPLGGIDAGALFDMCMEGTSRRRRTLSDSEIPEVKAKRSRTHNVLDAIAEAGDESGSVKDDRKQTKPKSVIDVPKNRDLHPGNSLRPAWTSHHRARLNPLQDSEAPDLDEQKSREVGATMEAGDELESVTSRSSEGRDGGRNEEILKPKQLRIHLAAEGDQFYFYVSPCFALVENHQFKVLSFSTD
ncbi:unnamed protein product [Haemonchus placei]|uniref:ELYS-bb domain-containing protein n=1 Tax=Haemonchus placei TaxID=6290 RepID=A0A0N4W6T8_HAEPC|nr:unnamed protein product [Haemonchus placei]